MVKLINADALKENLRTWGNAGIIRLPIEVICGVIDDRPEAIIRCKDCKHCEHWYGDKGICYLWHDSGIDVFGDGFCNYGERKTDE